MAGVGLQKKKNAKGTPSRSDKNDKKEEAQKAENTPVLKIDAGTDNSDENTETSCGGCKNVINDRDAENAIQCDHCSQWLHQKCSKLDKPAITFLGKAHDKYPGIKWFCPSCQSQKEAVSDHTAQQDAKIDKLGQMFLDLQTKMDSMIDKIGNDRNDLGKIEKNISVSVTEVLSDQREIDEKKNNMMVFNLSESPDPTSDLIKVKQVLTHVNPEADIEQLSCDNVTRLGSKKPSGDNSKPRPLKIVFKDSDTKWQFIKNAKKLGDSESFRKVGLSLDKTTKEREEDDILRKELAEKRKDDPEGDWIIFRKKIIKRANRQTVAKEMRKADQEAAAAAEMAA